jgi:hypothetical protein
MPASRPPRLAGALAYALLLASLLSVLASCGSNSSPVPTAATPSASGPASPMAGVITGIESTGLTGVHAFTLRTATGAIVRFTLGNLDNGTQFPPGHLAEHQLTGIPVLVFFRVEGSDLVVYHLEDAPIP